MPWCLPLIVLPVLVLTAPPRPSVPTTASVQSGEMLRAVEDLKRYETLVVQFRQGRDEVVTDLLLWKPERLSAAIALINTLHDSIKPWPADLLRSATVLHTDAAIRRLDEKAVDAAFFHFSIAFDVLQHGGPALRTFASRWVFAVSRLLRSRGRIPEAEQFLEIGRGLVPDDPVILYESGLLQEMFATEWPSAAPGIATRPAELVARRDPLDEVLTNRPVRLDKAEQWLRASLRSDGSNVMARLHLGRVQMMRRANGEALELLREVVESTADRATAYLAEIFTGALHERDGRLTEAAVAYERAIGRFGESHSAYLALSGVLQRAGRGDESRAVLVKLLTENPDTRREPWSWYFIEPANITRERLESVRREGRQ